MAIASLHRTLSRTFLTLGVVSLVACGGGGGGGGPKEPAPDTIPNAYSYTATTNAELSAVVTSAPVTISGINTATPVGISGGEYSINGGAFTSAAGNVTNGQSITIRLTAPAANSTSASAQLTVGGIAGTFTVTTKPDSTPDAFTFTARTNAELNTEYTSDIITVTGIDTAVPVSITGGEYSINGGAFTSASGTVSVNNTVAVKATSGDGNDVTHDVVVTIGGVTAAYSITTIPDTTPPVAEFKFPTPYTMSEANSVKVRGTATDDNAITSVKVVVNGTTEIDVAPKSEVNGVKDFSSWTATIPLAANTENEIKVIASDDRNNVTLTETANKVVIRQADVSSAFPDEVNQFDYIFAGLAIDRYDGRNRLLISELGVDKIFAVDIATGLRTVFSEEPVENDDLLTLEVDPISKRVFVSTTGGFLYEIDINDGSVVNKFDTGVLDSYYDMAIETFDGATNLVFVENVYLGPGKLARFSLATNQLSIISDENKVPGLEDVFGLAVDEINNRYLVASGGQNADESAHQIVAVDRITGTHSVFSSNSVGKGDLFSGLYGGDSQLNSAVVDRRTNSLLVSEYGNKLFSIDLISGDRKVLSDISYKNTEYIEANPYSINLDEESHTVFLIESTRKSVVLVDLQTGEKVILSKSANNF